MTPKSLIGKTFTVVDASFYRILLEQDSGNGSETNKFVLVTAEPVPDADFAMLEFKELGTK